jgi:hypothetical protein
MTYQPDYTLPTEILEQISQDGLEALPELIRVVINAAMQAERQRYLQGGHSACSLWSLRQAHLSAGALPRGHYKG